MGVFTDLSTLMDRYSGSNGLMTTLLSANSNESKTLTEERTRALQRLEARYDTMTARFIEYDAIMSRLNNQFSALQQQIEMAMNANG